MFQHISKILNQIIEKEKVNGDRRGLGYLSKFETLTSGKTTFMKPRENSSFRESSSKQAPKCTICNKYRHVTNKCFSRFFEKYQSQVNRLMS